MENQYQGFHRDTEIGLKNARGFVRTHDIHLHPSTIATTEVALMPLLIKSTSRGRKFTAPEYGEFFNFLLKNILRSRPEKNFIIYFKSRKC